MTALCNLGAGQCDIVTSTPNPGSQVVLGPTHTFQSPGQHTQFAFEMRIHRNRQVVVCHALGSCDSGGEPLSHISRDAPGCEHPEQQSQATTGNDEVALH